MLLCIEKALAQSGVSRHDVNYVNAHATSTKAGDLQEYKALMRSFGENPEVSKFNLNHFNSIFKRIDIHVKYVCVSGHMPI